MSVAETAELAVNLRLGTTGSFAGASGQIAGVERAAVRGTGAATLLGRGFKVAGNAASNFGGALAHARGRIVGLLTGPLGMLGLGAGLFSLGGLFKAGLDKARDFGGEVKRLAALTGLSVETTSRLAGAFDHFGIAADAASKIAGMAEKNLGLLTKTTIVHGKVVDSARKFQKAYGLALTDSSGHVKDFNRLLLDTADFWNNKHIPAQIKAVALSKLYGRSWQDLIPILGAGRKGIQAAEEEATRLGLTLTKDNITALSRLKDATRTWGDALGGLKLQIGLALLPVLTDLTKGLTTLVVDNRTRIVGFVRGIADGAEKLAGVLGSTVLPALKSFGSIIGTMLNAAGGISFSSILQDSAHFATDLGNALNTFVVPGIKAIAGAWDSLPGGVRDLIIKGFIANRVIKWTFGFDAVGWGVGLAKSFVSNIAGKLTGEFAGALAAVGIGKAFVQPVFVTNPGFGGAGGIPPVVASGVAATELGASAGVASLSTLLPLALPFLALLIPAAVRGADAEWTRTHPLVTHGLMSPKGGGAGFGKVDGATGPIETPVTQGGFTANFRDSLSTTIGKTIAGLVKPLSPAGLKASFDNGFRQMIAALRASRTTKDITAAVKAAVALAVDKGRGNAAATVSLLSDLRKKLGATHDPKLAAIIRSAIHQVEAKLPGRQYAAAQLAKADKLINDGKVTNSDLQKLKAIEQQLKDHGLPSAATKISQKVEAAKRAQVQAEDRVRDAIQRKKTTVSFSTTNIISSKVTVSGRDVVLNQYRMTKVGTALVPF